MIKIVSDNIISSLGFSSLENYNAISSGKCGLTTLPEIFGIKQQVTLSTINDEKLNDLFSNICNDNLDYTKFEKIAILSVYKALEHVSIDAKSDETIFVLSTTKGNVHLLECGLESDQRLFLWHSAKRIANFFGNLNTPIIVSNACISGVCAMISANRAILSNRYKNAIVVGADILSKFIISGFQSFKALSELPCKPFDINRCGLNLGEAAATVVMTKNENIKSKFNFLCGSIRNDANHISGPSRTGEGSYNALNDILPFANPKNDIAFINCHGTSTLYNDEMESIAIERAGLNHLPINTMKGYLGHTLGAAGILESIISAYSINNETILKTAGYETIGVSGKINPTNQNLKTDKKYFIKLISGFGGCNAAALFEKGGAI